MHEPVLMPYRRRLVLDGTAQTVEEIIMSKLLPDRRLWVLHVLLENETSAYSLAELVVRGRGYDHPIQEELTPQAGRLYWSFDKFLMTEGEFLVARFTGTTTGDRLAMYLTGLEESRLPDLSAPLGVGG